MKMVKTESIEAQCDSGNPGQMVCVFSEIYHDKDVIAVCTLLRDKGILFEEVDDYYEFELAESGERDSESKGLLVFLSMSENSFLMSLDEAIAWAKSLPYGRIVVEGIDYTALAELYAASVYQSEVVGYRFYETKKRKHLNVEDMGKWEETVLDRINGLLAKMQSSEDGKTSSDQTISSKRKQDSTVEYLPKGTPENNTPKYPSECEENSEELPF